MAKAVRSGFLVAVALAGASLLLPLHVRAGEGPAKDYMILTNLDEKDGYFGAVRELMKIHPEAELITFENGDLEAAAGDLKKSKPRYVTLVLKPRDIDMNFQGRLLTLCTGLDEDPFCDFSFGYVTGASAAEAVLFAKNIRKARKKRRPEKMLEVPTYSRGPSRRSEGNAKRKYGVDWPMVTLGFGEVDGKELSEEQATARLKEHVKDFSGNGLIEMGGHGEPRRICGNISGKGIRSVKPDLFPAVVYNYACLTGCVSLAFEWTQTKEDFRKVRAHEVKPDESLALAILQAGASAYIASIEPRPAGPGIGAEILYALNSGETLGEVRKREYDMLVLGFLSWGENGLVVPRFKEGAPRKWGDAVRDMMMMNASGAVLYGDPASGIGGKARELWTQKIKADGENHILEYELLFPGWALAFDPYRGWADRKLASKISVIIDLPEDLPGIEKIEVLEVKGPTGVDIEHDFLTWAVEETRAGKRLHLKLNGPPQALGTVGTKAKFRIVKTKGEGVKSFAAKGRERKAARPPGTPPGKTSLAGAVSAGDLESVKKLVAEGADVNVRDKNGATLLQIAARSGRCAVAAFLIEKGADVKGADKRGNTPLHDAARNGHEETVALLIEKGADIRAKEKICGDTPLFNASWGKKVGVMKKLVEAGADVNAVDRWGFTPLCRAIENGNGLEAVRFLLEKGAKVNTRDRYKGTSPLHWACETGEVEVIKLLLGKGADPEARDDKERTPLDVAEEAGNEDAVAILGKSSKDAPKEPAKEPSKEPAREPAEEPAKEPSGDYIAVSKAIGDHLIRIAQSKGKAGWWAESEGGPQSAEAKRNFPVSFYSGTPGTAFFLLNLYRVTGEEKYLSVAKGAGWQLVETGKTIPSGGMKWEGTTDRKGRSIPDGTRVGLYDGNGGIGLFLMHLHRETKEEAFKKAGVAAFERILKEGVEEKGGIHWTYSFTDIIGGEAGTGLALLEMHGLTKDKRYLAGARKAAKWLLASADLSEGTCRWKKYGAYDPNFSHGTAGIAFFLAALGGKENDGPARAAAKWVKDQATPTGEGGIEWRYYAQPPPEGKRNWVMNSWCHGAPGTVRLFLLLHRLTGEEKWLQIALKGGGGIRHHAKLGSKKPFYYNPTYCCGAAGCIDAFVNLYRASKKGSCLRDAKVLADDIIRSLRGKGEGLFHACYDREDQGAKKHPYCTTGFMLGNAGIGQALLHLGAVIEGKEEKLISFPDQPFAHSKK